MFRRVPMAALESGGRKQNGETTMFNRMIKGIISGLASSMMIVLPAVAQVSTGNPEQVQMTGNPTAVSARLSPLSMPADQLLAYQPPYSGNIYRNRTVVRPHHRRYRSCYAHRSYWQRHPMVKSATIGAGVGAGAGALTGLVTRRGALHGALVGAGAGAGVGMIRSSHIMRRHPIVKNTATGAVAGLGLGLAAGGRHAGLKGAGVGSAIGLGYGLYRFLR